VIFPREQTLKNSLPTSTPLFAGWLSRRVMARRENNFWRFAEWQCERGLQGLLTRITKRLTSVALGASSPDVPLTSCRVLLSLSGRHPAEAADIFSSLTSILLPPCPRRASTTTATRTRTKTKGQATPLRNGHAGACLYRQSFGFSRCHSVFCS
jgi:hypothetical protein